MQEVIIMNMLNKQLLIVVINIYLQFHIHPKPYKSGNILVHGALRFKNCEAVWNRDVNGVTNICRIAKNAINGLERPKYLCREKKEENVKAEKSIKEKVKKVVQQKVNKSVGLLP